MDKIILPEHIVYNDLDGICLINEETGNIFYTNERLDEIFGYNPGELKGMNKQLAPFPSFSKRMQGNDIAFDIAMHGMWSGEVFYLNKNGDQLRCKTCIYAFEQPKLGTIWVLIHTDLT
ncbi:MAG: PAS domain-containing protein [Spirochaetia bacterium]|nr:PAS domain-containing protein [Spirochaetia bacterium]